MVSSTVNVFSSSEREHLKNLLKKPDKDFQEIISLLEKKVQESSQQLRELDEKYQSLVDGLTHVGIGIDIVSKDYEVLFQNQVLKERFGDCSGKNCYRSYMSLENPCEFCPMEEALKHKKVERIELDAVDGRSYELISAPYPNPDGTIDKVAEVVIDITIRKGIEQKLRESEERYRGLINNISDIIFELNINGKCTYVSNRLFEISGFHPEEMVGQRVFEYLHPDDFLNITEKIKEAFNNGIKISIDFRLRHKKGYYVPVSSNFNMIKTNGDVRLIGVLRDNTEKKQAELKLRESEEEFRSLSNELETILDIIPGMLFCKDRNDRVTRVNQNFADSLDLKKEDIIGKTSLDLFPREQAEKFRRDDLEIYNSGLPKLNIEEPADFPDGNVWALTNKTPYYNENGEIIGIIGLAIDITDRKLIEEKLEETERRLRSLIEQTTDAVFCYEFIPPISIDLPIEEQVKLMYDCVLVECNLVCAKTYGADRVEDVIGRKLTDLFGSTPSSLDKLFRDMIEGGYRITDGLGIEKIPDAQDHYFLNNGYGVIEKGKILRIWGTFRDITDKKESEGKLKKSEEKYSNLFQYSNDAIILHDLDGNIVDVNQNAIKWLGYTKSEFLKMNISQLHPPEDLKLSENMLKDIKKNKFVNFEISFKRKNGEIFPADISAKIIEIENKTMIQGEIRDITDRKIIEQKLKESEENFRTIAEDSHLAITILQDDLVRYTNQRMADMFGYDREEMLTWTPKEYAKTVAEDSLEFIMEQARKKQIGDPDVITQYPIHCVKSSGEKFWVDNISTTIIYNGRPADLVTIIDTTDKRKAQQKLKESEEKFRTIAEQSLIGIGIIQDNIVKYINKKMSDILGYSMNEIMNWTPEEYINTIHPDYLDFILEQAEAKQQGSEYELKNYQIQVITKSGDIIWVENFIREITFEGKSADLIIYIDITERMKVQQELIKLNQLKTELLRRTSHELKTPLVSIKGFTELLLQVHRDKLDALVISTLNEIKQGCLRLETLISDILKTAELESGATQLKKSEEDLSFLITVCVNEIKGFSKLRNHTINLEIHENLITQFEKEQIHQVISNILTNAVKYTPPSGIIEIKSEMRDEFIVFSIKDNGIGFTEEEKTRIFKQFGKIERYGQGLDIIAEGSGFGLFISKKIVELHGGNLWVESEGRNKGSTFYFSLPIIED